MTKRVLLGLLGLTVASVLLAGYAVLYIAALATAVVIDIGAGAWQ